jgi:HEAT repeat protein
MRDPALGLRDLLESLSAREVRQDARSVSRLLKHRSPFVRAAAARALQSAGTGGSAIAHALRTETNELVICDFADALASLHAQESLPRLRQLAASHRSSLARRFALHAIADIQGKRAARYLLSRRKVEGSTRVQTTIAMELVNIGLTRFLPDVLRRLSSKDWHLRCAIANMLADSPVKRQRATVLKALKRSLAVETTVAARSSLEKAIATLSPRRSRRRSLSAEATNKTTS